MSAIVKILIFCYRLVLLNPSNFKHPASGRAIVVGVPLFVYNKFSHCTKIGKKEK